MQDRDDDTTIGRGGWGLVVASGLIVFVVLRYGFSYLLFPSLAFALAVALIVLLILYRLAVAVNRHDDAESERHVRRIVPASAVSEGTTRVSGIEGAQASPVVAVPVRPEPATPVPQRPAATVTPLAKLEPAPIILQRQVEAAPPPAAKAAQPAPTEPVEPAPPPAAPPVSIVIPSPQPAAKAASKSKAEPKAGAKSVAKSEAKSGAKAAAEVASAAPATAKPAVGFKGKAELEARAAAAPVATAAPDATAKPKATKAKAAAKPKASKKPAQGLVRLPAPRGGKADDLKLIDGVGPALERLVNSLGFYHFDQIAAWTEADVALVDAEMKSFKGRATRDRWVLQAKILANGGTKEEAAAAAKA